MNVTTWGAAVFVCAVVLAAQSCECADKAAVLRSGLPHEDEVLVSAVRTELANRGLEVREIGFEELCDAAALRDSAGDLLVLPNSSVLPGLAAKPIEDYLRSGGDIIALNAPMWQKVLIEGENGWLTRDEYLASPSSFTEARTVIDYAPETMFAWYLSNSNPVPGLVHESVEDGPLPGRRALHVLVPKLIGWDAYGLRNLERPFRDGATLTVFWAKGGLETTQMGVEWEEKDGSRWIAVVNLTQQWKQYVLTPQDFLYHPSNRSRGFPGGMLKPENATAFNVQVAIGVTDYFGEEPQEFWIGPIMTMKPNRELAAVLEHRSIPCLDALSPAYHLFDCTELASLSAVARGPCVASLSASTRYPLPKTIRAPYTRPSGAGFDKGRAWRYAPLLEVKTSKGEWRGNPAALVVHADGDFKGSVWASFGIGDSTWYRTKPALDLIGRVAQRMREGVFLIEGGSNFFTYFENQEMKIGIRAATVGTDQRSATARVTVTELPTRKPVFSRDWQVECTPGSTQSVSTSWKPDSWPQGGYLVTAELIVNGQVIDLVSHQAHVWRPKKKPAFVTVQNGRFMLDGKPWKPHGVNYMPSSGQAHEDYQFFNNWLSAKSYDPEVVQRDLDKLKGMGFNSVSVFLLYQAAEDQNLLDFLGRCELLGFKVNLFLGPSSPRDYKFEPIRDMIERLRLWENDTVFAYDLDWEPLWGPHDHRTKWDRDWEQWVVERYGSIQNAEKDWEFAIPRDKDGKVTNPSIEQIDIDGEWRRMVAAYRRFLDTLAYKYYSRAAHHVKSVDPNHLVSFRMSYGGCPTYKGGGWIAYDFPYLAACLDFLSPEAYGLVGAWERAKPGWFEREYARWAAPELPMIWAEAGTSVWDQHQMAATPKRLDYQAKVYRNFYDLMISSGADGVFWWFYPGGFRPYEASDFGIINPDGSDRPVTRVIRDYARKFLQPAPTRPVTDWITIDRDKRADGLFGVYEEAQERFWKLIGEGRVPGLRTDGTGTTSADSPLIAVGNTSCNGTNPPKYLDGAFNSIEVLTADGGWFSAENGSTVKIDPSKPVLARVALTNLGEAKWITARGRGGVCIVAQGPETVKTAIPHAVPHQGSVVVENVTLARAGLTEQTQVTVTLSSEGRTRFGEKFTVTLTP